MQFERILTKASLVRRIQPTCSACRNLLHVREIQEHGDDIEVQVDPCPFCLAEAEKRLDYQKIDDPDLVPLIKYALGEKRIFRGKPVEKLTPPELMALIGYLLREIDDK